MPLNNLYNRIVALQEFDVQKETIDIINENGEYMVNLLKEQLAAGKDMDGNNVTVFGRPEYSARTVFEKKEYGIGLGEVTDRITNYMTGEFYNSIYVAAIGSSFIFDSAISYFPEIIEQSGDRIMGLNARNLRKFSEEILKPQLLLRFKSKVNV